MLKGADEMEWLNSPSEDVSVSLLKCLLEGGSGSEDGTIAKRKQG